MTAVGTFLPKVFEEHFETVGFLWSRRRAALRSPEYVPADVVDLDDTIEAHLAGLAAAGDDSTAILEAELLGDDPLRAFAAAFALLVVGTPDALSRVCEAFSIAKGPKLDALRDALAHGPSTPLSPQLTSLALTANPSVGAAASEALAFRGVTIAAAEQLERFIRADEPGARASAWRSAAYCGLTVPEEWYAAGLGDDDANVKRAAFAAAMWNRCPAFYPYARGLAAEPTPDAIETLSMLAAVAPPEEYRVVGAVAANPAAGPNRFGVVSSFGHPYFIDFLIKEMENPDPTAAASAGAAFEKMTGWNTQSVLRKSSSAADETAAPEAAFVPDPASARKHWADIASRLYQSRRIARGFDVSQAVSREIFDALDMASRYEYCLRMRLFSGWQGTPLVLERYPQRS
jgi:uncharacterized protein (TIGR02270 family)